MNATIMLVIQLFFAEGPQVRGEVPMASFEECLDAVHQAFAIRKYQDKDVQAVAAGCYVPVTDRPS